MSIKKLLFYEHRSKPVLQWPSFVRRLITNVSVGAMLIGLSLGLGMAGYHFLEGLCWIDSFINAAMILSGMGPLWQPRSYWGKIFAGVYALYSGLAVIVIAGITLAPVAHRFLHILHAEEEDEKDK